MEVLTNLAYILEGWESNEKAVISKSSVNITSNHKLTQQIITSSTGLSMNIKMNVFVSESRSVRE